MRWEKKDAEDIQPVQSYPENCHENQLLVVASMGEAEVGGPRSARMYSLENREGGEASAALGLAGWERVS